MHLATLMAIVGVVIVGLYASGWLAGVEAGRRWWGLDTEQSLRLVVIASSVVALVLCFGPIVAVDERRLVRNSATLPMRTALATTLRNRPFLVYLGAQILFAFGITMIGPIAGAFCVASALVYTLYPERRVIAERVALGERGPGLTSSLEAPMGTGPWRGST